MTAALIHYSKEPINNIRSAMQSDYPASKPEGLWLSVEDGYGWKDWCEGEEFGLERLVYKTEIILTSKANILCLSSCKDIDEFSAEFYLNTEPRSSFECIDWASVAAKFQGIIIASYQWDRRLSPSINWYYPWDCSSGCIWDATTIERPRYGPPRHDTYGPPP